MGTRHSGRPWLATISTAECSLVAQDIIDLVDQLVKFGNPLLALGFGVYMVEPKAQAGTHWGLQATVSVQSCPL